MKEVQTFGMHCVYVGKIKAGNTGDLWNIQTAVV